MQRNDGPIATPKTLCVSIHDVAPQTWPQCVRLLRAIADVADIPVTLLVVPAYHRMTVLDTTAYERALERRLAQGDELALHGYSHLDEGPPPRSPAERFRRNLYTRGEGEFAALDEAEARRRCELGLAWFAERQWPVAGFVAPAWLVGAGTWNALADLPFLYTTTLREFRLLAQRRALHSPSLVYAARNGAGRFLSRMRNAWLLHALHDAPLVRLGLHPADVRHPALIHDCQRLIAHMLPTRQAITKSAFATAWSKTDLEQRRHFSGNRSDRG